MLNWRKKDEMIKVYIIIYKYTSCLVLGSSAYVRPDHVEEFKNKRFDWDEINVVEKELV